MKKVWIPLLLLALGIPSTGCWFHGPGDLKRELSREAGVNLDREFGITLGRTSMMLARFGLKIADEDEISLRGVRKVQVGVYQVDGLRRGVEEPGRLDASLFPDWEPLVRVREDGENVLVLLRYDKERIRAMLVAVTDDEEWVLVRIRGRLDRVVEDAMEMAFSEMDRPDLYARSREERGLDPLEDDEAEETVVDVEDQALILPASNEGLPPGEGR